MDRAKLAEWSEIANIVGAVTVVISLVFVGLQVKENTAALRSQNQRALINSLADLEFGRVTDADLAGLMMRAEAGEPLEGVDRYRAESLAYLYLNNWEQALHDYTHGLMEPEIWQALDQWLSGKMHDAYFRDTARQAIDAGTYSELFEAHLRSTLARTGPGGRSTS